MKSLVKYLDEKLVIIPSQVNEKLVIIPSQVNEKLVINKDYEYNVDFYKDFKEYIDTLFKDKFFDENPDIELCMYPKSRWSKKLRHDIIWTFNKYGNKTNPCYKGLAWYHSSNPVNKEACKIWEKFIEYIKDNKDELDLLICNEGFTCTYIINTDKALILLDGNTDIYYSEFSDGYIIIQYK